MEPLIAFSLDKALSLFGLAGAVLTFLYARNWQSLFAIIALLGTVSLVYTIITKGFGPWFFYDALLGSILGPGVVCVLVFLILRAMNRR